VTNILKSLKAENYEPRIAYLSSACKLREWKGILFRLTCELVCSVEHDSKDGDVVPWQLEPQRGGALLLRAPQTNCKLRSQEATSLVSTI
jgi:hypothetical protein